MTIFKSVNRTKTEPGPNFQPIGNGDSGGKPGKFYDEYVIPPAGFADGDSIEFGVPKTLRKGDRIIGMTVVRGALGAGVNGIVGDDGDDDRYITTSSWAAAGSASLANSAMGYVLTQDRPLLVKLSGAAPTPGIKVQVVWEVLRP